MVKWNERETTIYGDMIEAKARTAIINYYNVEIKNITDDETHKINIYDFETTNDIKYEVKGDRLSIKTGNFYIEYSAFNKPSGISISTANIWMLLYGESFYCISSDELKKLCRKYKDKKACCNFETIGYLIPVK